MSKGNQRWLGVLGLVALALAPDVARAGEPDVGHTHAADMRAMNARGDRAMGFSHEKTTHHFRLLPDGGAVEITVREPADTVSRNAIRVHLGRVAELFKAGDFSLPAQIHEKLPPGAPEMEKLKSQIRYEYEPLESGGRVHITTRNARALVAIHDFLRFQIREHRTGDPLEVLAQNPR